MSVALALLAMVIELCVGYPERLVRAIGHPASWIGGLIAVLDRMLNHDEATDGVRRMGGVIALAVIIVIAGVAAFVTKWILYLFPFGIVPTALVASSLIAQRSLHQHVAAVASALEAGDLGAGRAAVSHIVGRDTAELDDAGVARAAIESLAENFSDGVVAPVFWLAIAGLPGGALYKAINTADSMIGHRNKRYAAFGWAAARLDDLVNLPASRLAALILIAAAALRRDEAAAIDAWRTVWMDAAGALGLSLGGPRVYDGERVDDAPMGGGRWAANAADIRRALALYRTADAILIALLVVIAAIIIAPM
jgi:adenosylcobinamide-phosphate synthase